MSTLTPPATDKTLATLRSEFCAAVCSLTSEQMQYKPKHRPDAWCIQQIVEHLLLTYKGTTEILRERLIKGTPTKKPATFAHKCMQFAVITAGHFPRGQQAPDIVQPPMDSAPLSGDELSRTIAAVTTSLDTLLTECEQTLGSGRSVTHSVMGPMSMQQWRKFQLVHGRHHIRQIMAIRAGHNL